MVYFGTMGTIVTSWTPGLFLLTLLCQYVYCYSSPVKFLEEKIMDPRIIDPPSIVYNKSTPVKLGIYVNSFDQTDFSKDMQIVLNMYLRMQWTDPRFAYDEADFGKQITLPDGAREKIWTPDVFFRNEISSRVSSIGRDHALLKVNPDGQFWDVRQITVSLRCPMRLQKYPFDVQSCPLMFESFRYTMDTYHLNWLDSAAEVDHSITLPELTLTTIEKYDCSQNYTGGAFPCLEIRFVLRRDTGFFVKIYYIPTVVLVMLSWCTFWSSSTNFLHRVSFLTLLITLLFLLQVYVDSIIARVSYINGSDIWSMICQIMVGGAILQAVVLRALSDSIVTSAGSDITNRKGDVNSAPSGKYNAVCRKVDLISKIAFPSVFLLCVLIYFPLYSATTPK